MTWCPTYHGGTANFLTFGTNTKQSVIVLQKIMTRATMQNCTFGWSRVRKDTAAPMMHMIPTLYTLIPMYLLSFRAGILTFLVSQARKQPNNYNNKEQNGRLYNHMRSEHCSHF